MNKALALSKLYLNPYVNYSNKKLSKVLLIQNLNLYRAYTILNSAPLLSPGSNKTSNCAKQHHYNFYQFILHLFYHFMSQRDVSFRLIIV